MPKKDEKPVTMVAELTLTWPGGVEQVQTFDIAWHKALELPRPVNVKFNRFVRKEE